MFKNILVALTDVLSSLNRCYVAFMLGWQDIKQRYRRSKLGPFWLTISTSIMIAMIGIVFGQVLNSPMQEYLPFLATGLILWTCFSSSVLEGSTAFVESQGMIRQLNLPLSLYVIRVIWRNLIIFCHNLIILPFLFIFLGRSVDSCILWLIPGFAIFVLNIFWISLFLGTFCTRFRDMPQIVNSLLQVFFYITPILWMPNVLTARSASLLVEPNPIYHLIQIVRAPILGSAPSVENWSVSLGMAIIGILLSFALFGRYKYRIAYWL